MVEFQKLSEFFFEFIESDFKYAGDFYYDLHLHTTASDSFIKPEFLKSFTDNKRYLLAVTDHNEIRGAIKVRELGVNNVPGIELGCEDGFEILVYFKTMELLEEFYKKEVEGYKNIKRMAKTHRDIHEYLELLKDYQCHISIPHICGLVQKNFINNKSYIYDVIKKVESIETHNHALSEERNKIAAEIREKYNKTATFGSDAHILRDMLSYYKYANHELKNGDKILDYLFKLGSISGIGQKHILHMLKKHE
ncbi:PHP-associated domain-containing protein [uncultured Fusobacterium sp.]|uniref:PHP domain-containing protein n=1 Tax=uncultured Fusobacterium sp. TaxID=159267 RepID=UPI002587843F|nr:PHP-associated domain-containing protein [uncultured Fusobacterium sp.]